MTVISEPLLKAVIWGYCTDDMLSLFAKQTGLAVFKKYPIVILNPPCAPKPEAEFRNYITHLALRIKKENLNDVYVEYQGECLQVVEPEAVARRRRLSPGFSGADVECG